VDKFLTAILNSIPIIFVSGISVLLFKYYGWYGFSLGLILGVVVGIFSGIMKNSKS